MSVLKMTRQQYNDFEELADTIGESVIKRLQHIDSLVLAEKLADDNKIATKYKLIRCNGPFSDLTQAGKDLINFIRSKHIISLDKPECDRHNRCLIWNTQKECRGSHRCRIKDII